MVSRDAWLSARRELLAKEKEWSLKRDALGAGVAKHPTRTFWRWRVLTVGLSLSVLASQHRRGPLGGG